jgi:hypothetical protein
MKPILAAILPLAAATHAATLQVDFGIGSQSTTDSGWNNMVSASAGANPADITGLVDSTGAATTVDLAFSEAGPGQSGVAGTGANYTGPYPGGVSGLPSSALQDGLYLQNGNTITLTLSGLDPALTYDFQLYGGRGNNGTRTIFDVTGLTTGSDDILSVFNNSSEVAVVNGIQPTAAGVISVLVSAPAATSTEAGALNLMTVTGVPEPSVGLLAGLGILYLVRRRR